MERDRMKNGLVLVLWALAALAFGADEPQDLQLRIDAARARLDAAARELAELHRQDTFEIQLPGPESRVSLGVLLAPGGAEGVAIAGVTPGGPAAEAGIEAGDVVVTINGTNLRGAAGKPPLVRVFDVLGDVAPGDLVRVDYLRDGEAFSADVAAADPSPTAGVAFSTMAFSSGPDAPPMVAGHAMFSARGMVDGIELFALDEGLGRYFGVTDGVLVLSAPPSKDGGGLLAGDVVRAVDGRPVTSLPDCVNALGGRSGEFAVEVLRDGVELTVQAQGIGRGPSLMTMPAMHEAQAVRMIRLDEGAQGAATVVAPDPVKRP